MARLKNYLLDNGGCQEGIDWVGNKSLLQAYVDCTRPDWFFWMAMKLKIEAPFTVLAAHANVLRAISPLVVTPGQREVLRHAYGMAGEHTWASEDLIAAKEARHRADIRFEEWQARAHAGDSLLLAAKAQQHERHIHRSVFFAYKAAEAVRLARVLPRVARVEDNPPMEQLIMDAAMGLWPHIKDKFKNH